MKLIDLTGLKFGRLTVISRTGVAKGGSATWNCVCACGNKTVADGGNLKRGKVQSCRCSHRKHGKAGTRSYQTWDSMKQRCLNKNIPNYKYYGARGITICDRWLTFKNFLEDMGDRPEGMTLERKDNDKGYTPDNCKWATPKEQNRNSRHNRMIEHQGQVKCLSEWAEKLGISYDTLWSRLKRHPPQNAFNM